MAAAAAGLDGDDMTPVSAVSSADRFKMYVGTRERCFTWNHRWWPLMILGLTPHQGSCPTAAFENETSADPHTSAALW